MKKTAALLVAGSMFAVATPAMAQSSDDDNFSGFRVEALAGYAVLAAQEGSAHTAADAMVIGGGLDADLLAAGLGHGGRNTCQESTCQVLT